MLLLLTVLCFAGSNAAGVPLSEYHAAVAQAITDIRLLMDTSGHETSEDYENRITSGIAGIRAALPKNQQVEFEKGIWTTDNTWLHKALDNLEHASFEQRQEKFESVLEALRALDDRMIEFESVQKIDEHKGASKQKMESILARPEYVTAARGPNALTRLLRDLIRWIESLLPEQSAVEPGRARIISTVIMIVIVGLAVLMILYVLYLLIKRFKPSVKAKSSKKREPRIVLGERLQPEQTASDLLAEAETLARSGDLRAAIRKGYIALLVELGDRNVISLAQYKTNRDYLRSVVNLPQLHSPLKRLTETFERHW